MALTMIPMVGVLKKYGNLTLQEFAARVKDPFLATALRSSVDTPGWPMPGFPMVAMSGFARAGGEAGYPLGGSFKVASGIAEFYRALGGEIHLNSRVAEVLIENERAVGIRLEDGSEDRADIVVWAADGHRMIFDILGGKYLDETIRKMSDTWPVVKPMVHVCFGVDLNLKKEPLNILYELDRPITIAGEEFKWISIVLRTFDKSTAPPGKSALEVWYATDYKYWEELHRDRPKYEAEKSGLPKKQQMPWRKDGPALSPKLKW